MGTVHSAAVDAAHSMWVGSIDNQKGSVTYCTLTGGKQQMSSEELAQVRPVGPDGRASTRVVCISDLHGMHETLQLPTGDVLVVAGDLLLLSRHYCSSADEVKVADFARWLVRQPYQAAVVIAGNHDAIYERLGATRVQEIFDAAAGEQRKVYYLCDNACEVAGLKVYGSPVSHGKSANKAFQLPRGTNSFAAIPTGMDIVLTHQPNVHTPDLTKALLRSQPTLHVGGHLHWAYGTEVVGSCLSVTACVLNGKYKPKNLPIVVDIFPRHPARVP